MKKMLPMVAFVGLIGAGMLAGCQKQTETPTPPPATPNMPSTNAPAPPAAPAATNAPAQ